MAQVTTLFAWNLIFEFSSKRLKWHYISLVWSSFSSLYLKLKIPNFELNKRNQNPGGQVKVLTTRKIILSRLYIICRNIWKYLSLTHYQWKSPCSLTPSEGFWTKTPKENFETTIWQLIEGWAHQKLLPALYLQR